MRDGQFTASTSGAHLLAQPVEQLAVVARELPGFAHGQPATVALIRVDGYRVGWSIRWLGRSGHPG